MLVFCYRNQFKYYTAEYHSIFSNPKDLDKAKILEGLQNEDLAKLSYIYFKYVKCTTS